ncbi:MAG: TAXI family TRAP transporter solute-binding subunit [Candidatus Tectomicrobia bacterium]|uniref:TAXI family TRAP transporter solute-binding subunit n=1 Tax=Tectimicrobiota bacterium TaxID=2528274 RepID=A0A932MQE8_UNCTE|nr:TAXI family TRAP transporter solute-binding subunit [Candidatus Tectomicrobia bacterium]
MRTVRRCASMAAIALLAGMVLGPGAQAAMTQATIVGAGKGAGAFRQAGAIAEVVNKESKAVKMTNQETAGFVANTRMLANSRVEFALTNGVFVDSIQRKIAPFAKDKEATNLRGVGPMTSSWFQMAVLADGPIKSYMDLKGKRVSMGPKGSNTVYMTEVILETLGILGSVRKDYLKWDDAATYVVDGKLDAFGIPNPLPSPSILQAAQSRPVRILDLPDKVINKFISISKGYYKDTVDVSVYQGMEKKKIATVAYGVFLTAHDKVPAEVVYEVTRHFYDPKNRDFIVNAYKPLREALDNAKNDRFLANMKAFGLKLHPGAARYWKEKNFNVN